jgi:hypothetical protein
MLTDARIRKLKAKATPYKVSDRDGLYLLCLVALILSVGAVGCGSPRITADEVFGTWVLVEQSRKYLPAGTPRSTPIITLNRDGSFQTKDIPILFDVHTGKSDYVTGAGRWRVAELAGESNVVLEFQTWVGGPQGQERLSQSLFVSKWWSRIRLYYYLTDPDNDQAIEFATNYDM